MKCILYIGNELEERGGAPTLIDILPGLLEQEGFRFKTASAKKNKILRLFEMQLLLLKDFRNAGCVLIDTYSTQNFWYAAISARLCRMLNLPYILILHGGRLPERLARNPGLSQRMFNKSLYNITPSNYLFQGFHKLGIKNLKYIPNFVSLMNYTFDARKNFRPRLLWVRAFDETYNPMLALNVLKALLKKYPDASLCMVGPQKDGTFIKCRNYAEKHRLPVSFPGKLPKKDWIMLAADYDIFINTTNVDNAPVSVIEAMALGLPVVSTDVGGMPFLIENHKTGLLVPPDDAEAMTDAIGRLIENPQKAEVLSKAAREKAESFDWERVKIKWLQLLS